MTEAKGGTAPKIIIKHASGEVVEIALVPGAEIPAIQAGDKIKIVLADGHVADAAVDGNNVLITIVDQAGATSQTFTIENLALHMQAGQSFVTVVNPVTGSETVVSNPTDIAAEFDQTLDSNEISSADDSLESFETAGDTTGEAPSDGEPPASSEQSFQPIDYQPLPLVSLDLNFDTGSDLGPVAFTPVFGPTPRYTNPLPTSDSTSGSTSSSTSGSTSEPQLIVLSGKVVDGYIANATVFADANGNGILDNGEVSTTTDVNGNFSLTDGTGSLVMFGGTDVSTGLAFEGTLKAPEGSTIVTPLTTLVQELVATGKNAAAAETEIKQALNIDASFDLTTTDPIAAALAGNPNAAAAVKAGVEIASTMAQVSKALQGAGASNAKEASESAFKALAEKVSEKAAAGELADLQDVAEVTSVLTKAATAHAASTGETATFDGNDLGNAANVISASNEVFNDVDISGDATEILTKLAQAAQVSQGEAANAIEQSVENNDDTATQNFDDATEIQTQADVAEVGDVDGAEVLTDGDDTVDGSEAAESIDGLGGNDTLNGLGGKDAISGGSGVDTLDGGAGNDVLDGGAGNDTIFGGTGDDDIVGGTGDDTIFGGAGIDVARYNQSLANFNVSADNGSISLDNGPVAGNDTVTGVENIQFSDTNMLIVGAGSEYTTIQTAIDAAEAGDTIFVVPGTYALTETIIINKSITLLGAQGDVDPRTAAGERTAGSDKESIIDGGGSFDTLIRIAADNVTIKGFEIKSGTGDMIESEVAIANPVISYNIIHDATGDEGMQIRQASNPIAEFNHIFDIAQDAINFSSGSSDGIARFNEIHDIGSENAAIYLDGATNTTVEGNLLYAITGNDAIKVGDKGGTDAAATGGQVIDNVINGVLQDGITVYMSNVIVSGNDISGSTSENGAIFVDFNVNNITITDNTIHDNGSESDSVTTFAIRAGKDDNPTNITIEGNTFSDNEAQLSFKDGAISNIATVLADNTFDTAATADAANTIWSTLQDAFDNTASDVTITVVDETGSATKFNAALARAVPENDGGGTDGFHPGTGNSDTHFLISDNTDIGIEAALKVKLRHAGDLSPEPGTYYAETGISSGAAGLWNFDYSVVSYNGRDVADFDILITADFIDLDGNRTSDVMTFDAVAHSEATGELYYQDPTGATTGLQNSQNIGWYAPSFDADAAGSYELTLTVNDTVSGETVTQTQITVTTGDIVVGPAGDTDSDVNHASLNAAVADAESGDVVVIKDSVVTTDTTLTLDQAVTVVGENGKAVTLNEDGTLQIDMSKLPASYTELDLSGLDVDVALTDLGNLTRIVTADGQSLQLDGAQIGALSAADGTLNIGGDGAVDIVNANLQTATDGTAPSVENLLALEFERLDGQNSLIPDNLTIDGSHGDAFSAFWIPLDQTYVGAADYYSLPINTLFVYIGNDYVDYLNDGNEALLDIVKVPAGREQSLHDNLLGNLNDSPIQSWFIGLGEDDPRTTDAQAFGSRPIHSGSIDGDGAYAAVDTIAAVRGWDIAHSIDYPDTLPSAYAILDGDNTITGGTNGDFLFGGTGDDVIDGGAGSDTVILAGNRADFSLDYDVSAGTWSVSDAANQIAGDGTDTLSSIERIEFGNGSSLAFNAELANGFNIGTGNASTGFMIDTNTATGIEIGLKAKESFVGNDLSPDMGVYHAFAGAGQQSSSAGDINPLRAQWNIEYSIDLTGSGKTLGDFDIALRLDTDNAAGEPTSNFILDFNNIPGFDATQQQSISDLTVLQSSQNLGFDFWDTFFGDFNFDPRLPGEYRFDLTISDPSSDTLIGKSDIVVDVQPGSLVDSTRNPADDGALNSNSVAQFATAEAAISGANAGDVIVLQGDAALSGNSLALDKALTLLKETETGQYENGGLTFADDGTLQIDATILGITEFDLSGLTVDSAIVGTTGGDTLFGGEGNDTITGGDGSDILSGGGGNDTFIMTANDTGIDTIMNFAAGDTIDFGFNSVLTAGDLVFTDDGSGNAEVASSAEPETVLAVIENVTASNLNADTVNDLVTL